ncbi:PepSY-associated TM helix domain-containing protein [Cytobacillus horneckiae]|uniref:PepSY domain-containing protein n=1 Tax=Cytobacillus horneckiae TaxID=549687 RepID=A0A2N0ZL85_9BACI|nr:PepSY domain-containing protein [Cytobacillus horneckiae]MCM3177250.1 PepSY domain-containing protein [Cytobacillus horneckiae]MEC1156189.1 PepSY domain-containing protein [Cytobacillus horneckiae]MED2938207.1 PepSY domain-containing protein [Cytobacillus horneckiae]PKG30269.1 PepSY domain-containing protein [Cytobacillus horneckiae]
MNIERDSNYELEQSEKRKKNRKTKSAFYQSVWRWHFYAGLIFAPFLIILAFSGAVYLFKPQIESFLYNNQYYVQQADSEAISANEQLAKVSEAYPDSTVTSVTYYEEANRTTEFALSDQGVMKTVYVNPYNGEIAGEIETDKKFTEVFKKLHSELIIGGTVANRIVELAACWAVILLVTGLYIWWPRNKASIWGTILPRITSEGRTFWRDMHAVPAFWLSVFLLILIATGLPWSGVLGEQINRVATSTNTGYPDYAQSWAEKPESVVKTKDVAENVPWAAENLDVPLSVANGYVPLSLSDAAFIAENEKIEKPYTITMPQGDTGVYTIATSHSTPWDDATLHVDQYSGAKLTDVRFADYGLLAKSITVGIALHEGRLFGFMNQLIGLFVCMGLIGLIVSSFIMWKKRKPEDRVGAPPKAKDKKVSRTVFVIMLIFGVLMPLVGISIIIVYILDRFVIQKFEPLRKWFS